MPPKLFASLPLLVFAGLAAAVGTTLYREAANGYSPAELPSALLGRTHPILNLPPLAGIDVPRLEEVILLNEVTVVNVFASWCVPCRQEHSVLMKLAEDARISVVGINYKDDASKAVAFLNKDGNPFRAIGVDPDGRAAIDWGVYGVPETFVVDRGGRIVLKYVGPLDDEAVRTKIAPALQDALAQDEASAL